MVDQLFQIIFSHKAKQRIKEISDYYIQTTSPIVAQKIRNGIKEEARKLEKFPASKPKLPEAEDLSADIHYTKAWSFKLIFQIVNSTNTVRILTIRHDSEHPDDVKEDLT